MAIRLAARLDPERQRPLYDLDRQLERADEAQAAYEHVEVLLSTLEAADQRLRDVGLDGQVVLEETQPLAGFLDEQAELNGTGSCGHLSQCRGARVEAASPHKFTVGAHGVRERSGR